MNNSAGYHISNATTQYRRCIFLIYIDWLAKSLNFKSIENLWRIIKIQVSI